MSWSDIGMRLKSLAPFVGNIASQLGGRPSPTFRSPMGSSFLQQEEEEEKPGFGDRFIGGYRQMMDEPTPALDAYMQHVANIPQRDEYAPSVWRRLAAAVAGGANSYFQGPDAGLQTVENINQMPFRRALEDYDLKGRGLGAQAEIENNVRQTQLARFGKLADIYEKDRQYQLDSRKEDRLDRGENRESALADSLINYRGAQVRNLQTPNYTAFENADGGWTLIDRKSGRSMLINGNSAKAKELKLQADRNNISREQNRLTEQRNYNQGLAERNRNARDIERNDIRAKGTQRPPTPSNQADAQDQAMERIITMRPEYSDLTEQRQQGNYTSIVPKPQPSDPDQRRRWRQMMREVEDMKWRILRGEEVDFPEDEDDFEIIEGY